MGREQSKIRVMALALAAPLALDGAGEDLARHEFDLFETMQELRVEQRRVGGVVGH